MEFLEPNNTFDGENNTNFNDTMNSKCEILHYTFQPSKLTVPLYGYAMPILMVVTTTANTLVVAVLAQRNMKTPSNTILLAISLSDLLTLIVPAPVFFYMYTLGNYKNSLSPLIACYTWTFLSDVIPTLFHTASVWLTLALAAQRYVYICHSPTARILCTQKRVVKLIVVIFFVATVHQFSRFFENVYVADEISSYGHVISTCKSCHAQWLLSMGLSLYYALYYWCRVVFVHLLPCTLLVLLNALLYRALRKAQNTRRRLLLEKRGTEYRRIRETNCTTMMLIVIVSLFLITEIPLAIVTFLHILTHSGIVKVFSEEDYDQVYMFLTVSNFIIICSYPFNFAIYCGMSRQFRDTFAALFLRRSRTLRPREDSSRYTTVNGHRSGETILWVRRRLRGASRRRSSCSRALSRPSDQPVPQVIALDINEHCNPPISILKVSSPSDEESPRLEGDSNTVVEAIDLKHHVLTLRETPTVHFGAEIPTEQNSEQTESVHVSQVFFNETTL